MDFDKSFIEVQFPVSKISKESYKERKAGSGQTLTGLGKWWGRKPLILVRAALLGLLLPAGKDSKKDMEMFLKLLSMDEKGLLLRKKVSIPIEKVYEYLTPSERKEYIEIQENGKLAYKKGLKKEEREYLQRLVFNRLTYDEKLTYCIRPEELENLPAETWREINEYFGTNATTLQEFVQQMGMKRFGKTPRVGDCFCGGGSIPFEAARIGFDVYASDLNPIATLLTWSALELLLNSSEEELNQLKEFLEKIYNLADAQITEWGVEHNEQGDRADAYIYCNEVVCPECGWRVPLSQSWVISVDTKTIALLHENEAEKAFDIEIKSNASKDEIEQAQKFVTKRDAEMWCPHCKNTTPISVLRGDRILEDGSIEYGLRKWEAYEFIPQPDDVFQERLICIRYVKQNQKERYYTAPTKEDYKREEKVIELLKERFAEWQKRGYIPSSRIEEGDETTRLLRERGWTHWHQLFNPRQLLINGLLTELIDKHADSPKERVVGLLAINRSLNVNSKLSRWNPKGSGGLGKVEDTFYNQALNTLYLYGTRGFTLLKNSWMIEFRTSNSEAKGGSLFRNFEKEKTRPNTFKVELLDAREVSEVCDFWITDPPYADAVNYHELSEFFLAWDKKMLRTIFPEWYTDSKRALAVRGRGRTFNESMVEIYRRLAQNMPDNGLQIVMFTHQDVEVWANLALILWAAGLRVTAAWNVATETEAAGLKQGNYVKGTVLLVLRKQKSETTAYLDELYPEIEAEVRKQVESMRELDDKEDPNFGDTDYLLAAYAAALKVLTSYKKIEDIDIDYELARAGISKEETPLVMIIKDAIKVAYDYLVPKGFDQYLWKSLTPEERFYIKGLDLEKNGVYQLSAYQELARGFGVKDYREFLASTHANKARLKTALEFGNRRLSGTDDFSKSTVRNVLAALYLSIKAENVQNGKNWLRNELPDYWNKRELVVEILNFISTLDKYSNMTHWSSEARYARLLAELVRNDTV